MLFEQYRICVFCASEINKEHVCRKINVSSVFMYVCMYVCIYIYIYTYSTVVSVVHFSILFLLYYRNNILMFKLNCRAFTIKWKCNLYYMHIRS